MSIETLSLFAAVLASGLVAGLLFGWVVSVIPGLAAVDSPTYVRTMQNINREIYNPAFLGSFVGAPLLLVLGAIVHFVAGDSRRGAWLATAAATSLVGVLGVTAAGNIPLNDQLEAFDLTTADESATDEQRRQYEGPWNRWHLVRTLAAIAAFGLAVVAMLDAE